MAREKKTVEWMPDDILTSGSEGFVAEGELPEDIAIYDGDGNLLPEETKQAQAKLAAAVAAQKV